jgi:hypothetical protein
MLYAEGSFGQVEHFVGLGLPRLLAVPEELGEHTREWCEENLGAKWVILQSIETIDVTTDGKKTVAIEFESAWTPPTGVRL